MIMPQILWSGISNAYYSGLLVDMVADTVDGDDQEQ